MSAAAEGDAAVADALDEAARVLVRLAARLRAVHAEAAAEAPAAGARTTTRGRPPGRALEPDLSRQLGPRQEAVLGLGGLSDELGLTAAEAAKALG